MKPEEKMTVNSVSKIGQVDFGAGPIQVEAPGPTEVSAQAEAVPQDKKVEQKTAESASTPVLNGDVRLKFIVDSKTKEVTVLVLDKTSHQIIRTIPTDELKKLTRGDLVSIFA
jgi:uncharacterized FlaG/YvyC family protein